MAGWQVVELAMTDEEIENVDGSFAVENRTGESGVAGRDAALSKAHHTPRAAHRLLEE